MLTLGCLPTSMGSPLSWGPVLAPGTLTRVLGHDSSGNTLHRLAGHLGTGVGPARCLARAGSLDSLCPMADVPLWCFLEKEVHAILVEPSSHSISGIHPSVDRCHAGQLQEISLGKEMKSIFRSVNAGPVLSGGGQGRRSSPPHPKPPQLQQGTRTPPGSIRATPVLDPLPSSRPPLNLPAPHPLAPATDRPFPLWLWGSCSGLLPARWWLDALFVGGQAPPSASSWIHEWGSWKGWVCVLPQLSGPLSSAGSSQGCQVAQGPHREPTWGRRGVGESHCCIYSGSPKKSRGSASSQIELSSSTIRKSPSLLPFPCSR